MTNKPVSRREFMETTNWTLAGSALFTFLPQSVFGANDKISIGAIGCGSRMQNDLLKELLAISDEYKTEVTAVCDVWRQHREKAAEMVKEKFTKEPKQYVDYIELLNLPAVDAVMIAAPDHTHTTILRAAVKAGKDAYCEKPLSMTIDDLNTTVDIVKQSGRVVQIGTQLRSYPSFTGCRKVVQEGALGSIVKIMQVRNSYRPYWYAYKRPIVEADTDWKRFLMNKPDRPFDPDQHSAWYGYRDFTLGPVAGMMSHYVDLVHYITGAQFPRSAVAMGGNYYWNKDNYTIGDSVHALLDYPEGFMVSYASSYGNGGGNYLRFFGTKGMIDATDWRKPVLSGEGSEASDKIKEEKQVPDVSRPEHMEDWVQCLRSRKQPNANIDAGEQHAVACILANEALEKNHRMVYDRATRTIKPA